MIATRALVAALLFAGFSEALAQENDLAGASADPRFRTVAYSEHLVVPLRAHVGYQVMIEFDDQERIENVALGDSAAWQVTPNRAATLLFVKPLAADAQTNMTVITNRRTYAFGLSAAEARGPSDPNLVYGLRFTYPERAQTEAPRSPPAPPRVVNADYVSRGAARYRHVGIFDDGAATYFLFQEGAEIPAIFVINDNGEEELADTQARPPYIVVDRLAQGFMLRSGQDRLRVRNNNYGISIANRGQQGSQP
jgi:type IV secretion system protein VirB9